MYQRCKHSDKSKQLPCPAMNTHDAVTKTCMDNYYSQRESVVDALKRCTDTMLAGKTVLICGYGQVRAVNTGMAKRVGLRLRDPAQ